MNRDDLIYSDEHNPDIHKTLEKCGIVVIRDFLKIESFQNLEQETNTFIAQYVNNKNIQPDLTMNFNKLRKSTKTIINKRIAKRDGDEGLLDIWNINKNINDNANKSLDSVKEYCLSLCNLAFELKYKFFTTNMYYNKSVSTTRGIHSDSGSFPSRVKSFLYMTDIKSVHDGPFSYILGSYRGNQNGEYPYHRKYKIYKPHPPDVNEYVIFDDLCKNDLIIACIAGAHRGIPQKKDHTRIAYVQSYDPTAVQSYDPTAKQLAML